MAKNKKKICLFIVEGISDQTALAVPLVNVFKKYTPLKNVKFEITHGDITSRLEVRPDNIIAYIGKIVKKFMRQYKLKKEDFAQIVQIVDTDGAYISPEYVRIDDKKKFVDYPHYTENEIYVPDKQGVDRIIERNTHKQENLNKIYTLPKIMDTEYAVYYFSCNLDHVLYGVENLEENQKVNAAEKFAEKYKEDADDFLSLLESFYPKNIGRNRKESWDYICQGQNSLRRNSNFILVFTDLDYWKI